MVIKRLAMPRVPAKPLRGVRGCHLRIARVLIGTHLPGSLPDVGSIYWLRLLEIKTEHEGAMHRWSRLCRQHLLALAAGERT